MILGQTIEFQLASGRWVLGTYEGSDYRTGWYRVARFEGGKHRLVAPEALRPWSGVAQQRCPVTCQRCQRREGLSGRLRVADCYGN